MELDPLHMAHLIAAGLGCFMTGQCYIGVEGGRHELNFLIFRRPC